MEQVDLDIFFHRVNRFKKEINLKAPEIVLQTELRLIKRSCETLLDSLGKENE